MEIQTLQRYVWSICFVSVLETKHTFCCPLLTPELTRFNGLRFIEQWLSERFLCQTEVSYPLKVSGRTRHLSFRELIPEELVNSRGVNVMIPRGVAGA